MSCLAFVEHHCRFLQAVIIALFLETTNMQNYNHYYHLFLLQEI